MLNDEGDQTSQPSSIFHQERWAAVAFWASLALLTLLTTFRILRACDGRLIYSLDDPYIHLALAKNIALGHYGLNLGEAAAPSSSVIWPLLLAPFAWTGWFFEYVPLFLNLITGGFSAWVILRFLKRWLPESFPYRTWMATLFSLIVFYSANGVGVAFTGMEHSLHILCALLVVSGLIDAAEGDQPGLWLTAALIAGPLVRYEALLMALLAAIALACMGRWKQGLLGFGGAVLGLGAFSLFLSKLGLGALPSSIQAKSSWAGSSDASFLTRLAGGFASNWEKALETPAYLFFISAAVILLLPKRESRWKWVCLAMIGTALGHFLLADRGWMLRYEIYLYASLLPLMLVAILREESLFSGRTAAKVSLSALGISSFLLWTQSLENSRITPLASGTIHRQQEQMMRFVRDFYRGSVAVNDLGWVAFAGGQKTLDLWGLGSHQALKLRKSSPNPSWVLPLCENEGVRLMMVYRNWVFPRSPVPSSLIQVGSLVSESPYAYGAAEPAVDFYALDQETAEKVRRLLPEFTKGLPSKCSFKPAE
jgi:hypothetical protein